MRLFEVVQPPTRIVVTDKFLTDYEKFKAADPKIIPDRLKRFCELKLQNTSLGPDDRPFSSNSHLRGYSHYHLIKGKAMVMYKRSGNDLRLYEIVEHDAYESQSNQRSHGSWADKLSDKDFTEFDYTKIIDLESKLETKLTSEEIEFFMHSIYEIISADGFFILKDALEHNNWEALFDYVRDGIENINEKSVFNTFGGENHLKKIIIDTIKQFGAYDKYLQA